MKRFALFFAFLVFVGLPMLQAQTVQITGKVTNSEDGNAIPGVSVVVKGTTIGTTTDFDGKYSLNVPSTATSLVFSFVGLKSQEVAIGGRNSIEIVMETDVVGLEEVVVTALGISREKKSLGYTVQDVKADELNQTRTGNVITSLSGKVAGVSVASASGNMGGSTRITIRGVRSISGNNQPLFVVDGVPLDNSSFNTTDTQRGAGGYDYGSTSGDINPDDIESVSVLKGPSAASLYGSRAANGVILITTKKGKIGKDRIGVEINSSVAFEQVSILPKYQNLYGGGSMSSDTEEGFGLVDINGTEFLVPDYGTDESYGPKYDPTKQVLQYNNIFDWEANGKQGLPQTSPWIAPKHDVKDFFETGVAYTNNIALTGGSDKSGFRLSYTNFDLKGYMPNSSLKRNTIGFNGDTKLGNKVKAFTSVNYVKSSAIGRASTGYDDNNIMQKFNQWGQRQLDMEVAKNYVNPDGSQRVWNRNGWDDPSPAYSDNPYWTRYRNYQNDDRNRLYGNVGLNYAATKWLTFQGKVNADYYNNREMERVAIGSAAQSGFYQGLREFYETNSEILATVKHRFSDNIDFNATVGGNQMYRKRNTNRMQTKGGLVIPELYTLTNSASPAETLDDYTSKRQINSLYGTINLGFYNTIYVDASLRNDWSSTLSKGKNSYMYPAVTTSFLFSELAPLKGINWFNLGKVRVGWAQAGSDTDPYSDRKYYNYVNNFGSDAMYRVPNTLFNKDLKSEMTTSVEFGTDLLFFNKRVGFSFTYYSEKTTDQILSVAISGASGYGFKTINAGEITNKGIEATLNLTPILTTDFSWDIAVNFTHNKNQVVELAPDINVYQLANGPFNVSVNAEKGQAYGSLIGRNYVTKDGNKIVGTNGKYLNGKVESLGNVMPDFMTGIWNTFKFKGIELAGLIDIRKGGKLFSTTNMWGNYSGILEETAAINANGKNVRDAVADGGGALSQGYYGKVLADGTVQYTDKAGVDSDVPVLNETYVAGQTAAHWYYDGPAAQNIFKADYIKLRELRLSYSIPTKFTKYVQNVKLSVYGRNLAVWGQDNKHFDPENTTGSGNIQGIEGGALPSLRNYGVNLSFSF